MSQLSIPQSPRAAVFRVIDMEITWAWMGMDFWKNPDRLAQRVGNLTISKNWATTIIGYLRVLARPLPVMAVLNLLMDQWWWRMGPELLFFRIFRNCLLMENVAAPAPGIWSRAFRKVVVSNSPAEATPGLHVWRTKNNLKGWWIILCKLNYNKIS